MSDKPSVWVEIDILKDTDTCTTMRGKIELEVYKQLIKHSYEEHFFRMDHVHGVRVEEDEEKGTKTMHFGLYGYTGPLFPLKGHSYLRTKDIREISPLKDDYAEIYETAKFQESIDF